LARSATFSKVNRSRGAPWFFTTSTPRRSRGWSGSPVGSSGSRALPYSLEATTSRREALRKADFVIIAIEVGDRYALWEQDWKVPLQFGIHQVYGENGGPGGLFHSLRIIPRSSRSAAMSRRSAPRLWSFP